MKPITERKKQPFVENKANQQMTVGNIVLSPYPQKPFDIWLQEQAIKTENQSDV